MFPRVESDPQRVSAALGFQRPDAPPLALSLAMQAGRTTGTPLPRILRDPDRFADAQIAMHDRWQHDIAVGMLYSATEAEAFGARVAFFDDGPPNVASILVRERGDLDRLPDVDVTTAPPLAATLHVIARMKTALSGRALVSAVALGPVSGPVLWMGMERWLDVLMTDPDFAADTVARYAAFALAWARAQIAAGADILIWFEPFASTAILPLPHVSRHVAPALHAACGLGVPVVLHLASDAAFASADMALSCGVTVLSIGVADDGPRLREATAGRLSLIGGLEGIGLHHWSRDRAVAAADAATRTFGGRGGFVLSDAHGEIPWQVAPETLDAIVGAVRKPL